MGEPMNERARAWQAWLESDEGVKCENGTATGEYLRNRLWYAFNAGFDAGIYALHSSPLPDSAVLPSTSEETK